ncbi:MAG: hypothetical protein P1Q69_20160, partial [Candidatus Thorarchaeota archaeon]|nr:hypothetical protein [Candidatus Thorarchaeota archaeon]
TIYGLVSAAAGEPKTPFDTFVCYTFVNSGEGVDLEKIYEVNPGSTGKFNVIKREFLTDNRLVLYVSPTLKSCFESPYFPLLLGRSGDLATVEEIDTVKLTPVEKSNVSVFGRGLYTTPPPGYRIATMYSLPVYFTDTIPREAVGSRGFYLIAEQYQGQGEGYVDTSLPSKDQCSMELFSRETLGIMES